MAMALLFAGLTGLGMMLGVWAIQRFEGWAIRHTGELIAFASGLLVSGALLHLLERSIELAGSRMALVAALASFLVFYMVEAHFVPHVHGRGDAPVDDDHLRRLGLGPIVIGGLALHSVVDGVSVGAALSASALIGWATLLVVFVHKMPVGIAAMSALFHSGVSGRRAVWIVSGLALVTPVTVVISFFLLRDISDTVLGGLLSIAAGSFLYIGAADLLPEGQARGRPMNTVLFVAGIAVMVVLGLVD